MSSAPQENCRIDQWLWAVRLFKTRSAATAACNNGEVRVDGGSVKPARRVKVGEQVDVKRRDHVATYEVVRLIKKRVGAPIAVECYIDHTPERPTRDHVGDALAGVRDRGAGRPTKRDRRQIERLRNRR